MGMTGFLRRYIAWYNQKGKPLQKRKTELIATKRKSIIKGVPKTPTARKRWAKSVAFEPNAADKEGFRLLQAQLTDPIYLPNTVELWYDNLLQDRRLTGPKKEKREEN
ncbi:uncharacterized protein GGS25DRAFT_469595 [Hypoxylon fragiforme]|uniref:uncharacterized protein n=1 Tax=Hypoxylon fragiforme TaxID=63214 RepID=UPI0020C5C4E6|nr:uncharacterized protein GGS25DRAFT_469595 [Hypoxylon fragiforme]KAI2613916.1 hypothetical protein GGS25DRAFT_469595 [Hypoxylon fragiforme]